MEQTVAMQLQKRGLPSTAENVQAMQRYLQQAGITSDAVPIDRTKQRALDDAAYWGEQERAKSMDATQDKLDALESIEVANLPPTDNVQDEITKQLAGPAAAAPKAAAKKPVAKATPRVETPAVTDADPASADTSSGSDLSVMDMVLGAIGLGGAAGAAKLATSVGKKGVSKTDTDVAKNASATEQTVKAGDEPAPKADGKEPARIAMEERKALPAPQGKLPAPDPDTAELNAKNLLMLQDDRPRATTNMQDAERWYQTRGVTSDIVRGPNGEMMAKPRIKVPARMIRALSGAM